MTNNYHNKYFEYICKIGDIIFAKKVLYDNPIINNSLHNGVAFRCACAHGNLDIAKWLLQIQPNINIFENDNYAFKCACEQGCLKIAVWLQSFKPYLYVIKYNSDGEYAGYYVRTKEEAKEARWQQTKYLVWLSSLQSPNAKCIFYKLPNDISRYIIQNFI